MQQRPSHSPGQKRLKVITTGSGGRQPAFLPICKLATVPRVPSTIHCSDLSSWVCLVLNDDFRWKGGQRQAQKSAHPQVSFLIDEGNAVVPLSLTDVQLNYIYDLLWVRKPINICVLPTSSHTLLCGFHKKKKKDCSKNSKDFALLPLSAGRKEDPTILHSFSSIYTSSIGQSFE